MNANKAYCKRISDKLDAICCGIARKGNGETLTLREYLASAADYDRDAKGVVVWFAKGEKSVYIDTFTERVTVECNGERDTYNLDSMVCFEINKIYR